MTESRNPTPSGTGNKPRRPSRQEPTFDDYVTIFLRGKWVILSCFILVAGTTALYTFLTKPVYEATAMVLIDMKGGGGSQLLSLDITGMSAQSKITNELEILKTGSLAETVARTLLEKGTVFPGGKERLPIIETPSEDGNQMVIASQSEILRRLDRGVEFTPIRESDIIKISARSTDPREAAILSNVYAEAYVDRNMSTSRTRSRAVREFLEDQRDSKRKTLDATESALQAYMSSSGTVSLDDETKKVVEQLSALEATRDGIEVEISSRRKTLDSYKEELARQEPAVARSIGESNDTYVRLLQEQIATLQVQRDVIVAQNPTLMGRKIYEDKLKEIDEQISALKLNLQNRTTEFLKSLVPSVPGEGSAGYLAQTRQKIIEGQIELAGLEVRKRALNTVIVDYEKQFSQIPQKSINLAKLQRARLSSEKLYLLVEEKFNEAAITEKSEFGYVDIIDPARVPDKPVSPKIWQNLILGVLAGLGLGMVVVLLRERFNLSVRTPEDLKRHGFTLLSAVSRMVSDGQRRNGRSSTQGAENGLDPHLIVYHSPLSSLAESYRRLRTNVQFAQLDRPIKTIMVTSPSPGEGKSTTVANLAITFAQADKRVLLVDTDMRKSAIHRYFNIRKEPGLTDYFLGELPLEKAIQPRVLENLDMLPCGTTPPNPSEILGSRKMVEFIKRVSETYDIVLFDSPPLLAVTDAAVLATIVDGAILVASSGFTRVPAIEHAVESLGTVGGKVLGVLLNNFDPMKAYGGYGHYRHSYYGYSYGDFVKASPAANREKGGESSQA